ncbi:coiled-coil domain-containing protein 134 isoform X6 [Macaca fascicularis]|uniref:coiled-coil domain-containing protein 134 isoform X6 n=1 Tax=Macaca fascicularis TaxID=9541 RepID=UPI003D15A148
MHRLASSRGLDMDLLQFLAFLFVLLLSGTGATGTLRTSLDPSLEIYKKMFEVKRREQLLALKNLAQLNDIHQQYKILDVMLKGLFKLSPTWWRTRPSSAMWCCASRGLCTITLTTTPTGTFSSAGASVSATRRASSTRVPTRPSSACSFPALTLSRRP